MAVEGTPIATDDLSSIRNATKYTNWIKQEFKPLTLATPDATIVQCLENAIRYWNIHSAYKISTMVEWPSTNGINVQLPESIKSVVSVYPSHTTSWIWNDHPLWTMLGITVLDNVTSDLIMMSEAFRNYRVYVGTEFKWTWQRSSDPNNSGGYLYIVNAPQATSGLFCVGTKRIMDNEDIKEEPVLDWILNYTLALVKIIEGNTLRKSSIVGVSNDGGDLLSEGKTEKNELKEKLARDGRWVAFAKRF